MKTLQQMSLEELWQLFPITLESYNPAWSDWAEEEMSILKSILMSFNPMVNHIGSTAITGILAKPIVDILVETADSEGWDRIVEIMESSGYILMSRDESRMSFNKGYTVQGYEEKVFHVHFHLKGDRDEIFFRDYLNGHPSVAKEYEDLKKSLLPRYVHDRDGYTAAKSDFITNVLSLAISFVLGFIPFPHTCLWS